MNTMIFVIPPARRLASERVRRLSVEPLAASLGRGARFRRRLSPFEKADLLVQAWGRNEQRLGELGRLEAGIAAARRRLATSAVGRGLVEAHLARLLARRAACVDAARADAALAAELSREWDDRPPLRRAAGG